MRTEPVALASLDKIYAELLEPASLAKLLANGDALERARNEYADTGSAKIEGVLAPRALEGLAESLIPVFETIADEVLLPRTSRGPGELSDGARFRRIDPECAGTPKRKEAMTRLFDLLRINEFGAQLGASLQPVIRRIAGAVAYRRIYFYLYEEGDHIGVHDDRHVGPRVDVQWPLSIRTSAGVRVLHDGLMRMHHDVAGSMNVLGPYIWHDVPPVIRSDAGARPLRFNMGMRFTPD